MFKKLAPALALALMLGGVGSARAISVEGRWDPQYGMPFTGPAGLLGWEGTATWFLPDACSPQAVSAAGTFVANGNACSSNGMQMLSATVNFYDYGLDPTGDTSFLTALTFGPGSAPVLGMTLSGATVLGVNTGLSLAQTPVGSSFDGIDGYSFALKFTGDTVQLFFAKNGLSFAAMTASSGYDDDECDEDDGHDKKKPKKKPSKGCPPPPPKPCVIGDIAAPSCGVNDPTKPAKVSFSVAEPPTYALVLGTLVGIGFVSRRRRRASTR